MQTLPLAPNAHARRALPLRDTTARADDEAIATDRFVPAATWLAVVVTVVLIFFGRW